MALALAVCLLTVLVGCGGSGGSDGSGGGSASAAAGGMTVSIRDFRFTPATLTVPRGTTVTFTNEDGAPHTATGKDFDTGELGKGRSKAVTFDRAGTFPYICDLHQYMKGTIVVE